MAPDNNRDNIYISAASLNGQTWDNSYIDFDSIQAGGQIEFQMSEQPNPNWAGDKEQFRNFIKLLVGDSEKNPGVIVDKLKEFMFCNFQIKSEERLDALSIFKGDVPENYYEDGTWDLSYESVPKQVYDLILFFISLPEFQLK